MSASSVDVIHEFFANAIPGTEGVLCEELRDLGFASVRLNRGGIPFRGTLHEGFRACLASRIAQRIQLLMGRFPAPQKDALYAGVRQLEWERYLTPAQTLTVKAVCRGSVLTHSGFVGLTVKDAIVDRIRAHHGSRPSIDREDADIRVFLHLANNKATVYLDLSGEPLHRRGYRTATGDAPLRETLAAALLRMAAWDRKTTLIDPLCGSGTLAIEAAMWAGNLAPGLSRSRFGFERWACFSAQDAICLRELCGRLRASVAPPAVRILATDCDPDVLHMAKKNARCAGVKLAMRQQDVLKDFQPPSARALVITNPPYGVRLDKDPLFARKLMAVFSRCHGCRVAVLAGHPDFEREMSLRTVKRIPLKNGNLDCTFLIYDIPA